MMVPLIQQTLIPAGINSSGAAGGGIIIVHAGAVVGTGTITANGQTALDVLNDGAGGGGAGGSIELLVLSGGLLARLSVPTAATAATPGYLRFPAHPILAIVTDLVVEAAGA